MNRLTGIHAVREALEAARPLDSVLIARGRHGERIEELVRLARQRGVPVRFEDRAQLDRTAGTREHQGVLALASAAPASRLEDLLASRGAQSGLLVLLDGVEDPQNLGAIVRSADVFAADLVLLPRRRAAPLSSAVARASAGALAYVPVATVPNLAAALRRLADAGFWTYAADMGGEELSAAELPARCVFVFGNEGAGVSRLLRDECDAALSIRQAGHVDSLNVSAAAAIMMYEYRRRHPAKGDR